MSELWLSQAHLSTNGVAANGVDALGMGAQRRFRAEGDAYFPVKHTEITAEDTEDFGSPGDSAGAINIVSSRFQTV